MIGKFDLDDPDVDEDSEYSGRSEGDEETGDRSAPSRKDKGKRKSAGLFDDQVIRNDSKSLERYYGGIYGLIYEKENLGEDYASTAWLAPNVDKAKNFRDSRLLGEGKIPLRKLSVVDTKDLSSGATLYFQLLKSLSVGLSITGFLSIPLLAFAYFGEGIELHDQDGIGLYQFTLGNVGYQSNNENYYCESLGFFAVNNDTCIAVEGIDISLVDVSSILTLIELLCALVLFITICWLQRRVYSRKGHNERDRVYVSDYTVMVTNIPDNTTEKQLLTHFSDLYQLKRIDFRGRLAIDETKPIKNNGNTGCSMYLEKWVAEVIVHKKIGGFLRAMKEHEHWIEKLYRHRARYKMHAVGTSYQGGYSHILQKRAASMANRYEEKLDQLMYGSLSMTKAKEKQVEHIDSVLDAGKEVDLSMQSNVNLVYNRVNSPSIAAFVTFEYAESRARCLEDYKYYNFFPLYLFYPTEMKFRGRHLKVQKAPEPEQILWENLEVVFFRKAFLIGRTLLVMLALIVLSLIVVISTGQYRSQFVSRLSEPYVCDSLIPNTVLDLFPVTINSTGVTARDLIWTRPPPSLQIGLNAACNDILEKSFYAIYTIDGNFSHPVFDYDINSCTTADSEIAFCPAISASKGSLCPCVNLESFELCTSTDCSDDGDCRVFEEIDVGNCVCQNTLNSFINSLTPLGRLLDLDTYPTGGPCEDVLFDYSWSFIMLYLTVIFIYVLNRIIVRVVAFFARREGQFSIDEQQVSVATKVFFSLYINMSIVGLMAYGKIGNLPNLLQRYNLFSAAYDDTDRDWYGFVGTFLVIVFIFEGFLPLISTTVHYFVWHSCGLLFTLPAIR